MMPSGSHRAKSPVRYIRAPGSFANGSGTNRSAVSSGRFRYPRAAPAPPTYNSPTTPTGTGAPLESSMYIRAFAIGRPIGMLSPDFPRGQLHAVAFTAASVGPY